MGIMINKHFFVSVPFPTFSGSPSLSYPLSSLSQYKKYAKRIRLKVFGIANLEEL